LKKPGEDKHSSLFVPAVSNEGKTYVIDTRLNIQVILSHRKLVRSLRGKYLKSSEDLKWYLCKESRATGNSNRTAHIRHPRRIQLS